MVYYMQDGIKRETEVIARIDSDIELDYYRDKGVLNYVIRRMLNDGE